MRQSSSKLTLSRKKGSCLSWLIVTVKQDHFKNFNCWRFYITACFWHTFSGMKSIRTTENLLTISFLLSRAAFCSRYNWSDKELGVKSLQVYISCPRWTNEWFSAAAVQTTSSEILQSKLVRYQSGTTKLVSITFILGKGVEQITLESIKDKKVI